MIIRANKLFMSSMLCSRYWLSVSTGAGRSYVPFHNKQIRLTIFVLCCVTGLTFDSFCSVV